MLRACTISVRHGCYDITDSFFCCILAKHDVLKQVFIMIRDSMYIFNQRLDFQGILIASAIPSITDPKVRKANKTTD